MNKFKIPEQELHLTFSRSSGAGGQNINKVNSKATLHWNVFESSILPLDVKERFLKKFKNKINEDGVLILVSQEHRTQNLNTSEVIRKLHDMIESVAIAPKRRIATKPSKSAVKKRLGSKKLHGDKKKLRQEKF